MGGCGLRLSPFAGVGVIMLVRALAFAILGAGVLVLVVRQLELRDEAPRKPAERLLIGHGGGQLVEVGGGFFRDLIAPEIEQASDGLGRRHAGHALAQQKPDGRGDLPIVTLGDLIVAGAPAVFLRHGAEVGSHARHADRAQRFHAGHLGGVEHAARLLLGRHVGRVIFVSW